MAVQGMCDLSVVTDLAEIKKQNSALDKPFLRLAFPNGITIDISTNLAEMIGGIGKGARERHSSKIEFQILLDS